MLLLGGPLILPPRFYRRFLCEGGISSKQGGGEEEKKDEDVARSKAGSKLRISVELKNVYSEKTHREHTTVYLELEYITPQCSVVSKNCTDIAINFYITLINYRLVHIHVIFIEN